MDRETPRAAGGDCAVNPAHVRRVHAAMDALEEAMREGGIPLCGFVAFLSPCIVCKDDGTGPSYLPVAAFGIEDGLSPEAIISLRESLQDLLDALDKRYPKG